MDPDKVRPLPALAGESAKLVTGCAVVAAVGPYVLVQIVLCTVWEAVDKRTVRLIDACTKLCTLLEPYTTPFVRNEKDGFITLLLVSLGVLFPAWFFYELHYAAQHGLVWWRIGVYNLCRIGPMYMNFMYVYVLCHKEAHVYGNFFRAPYSYLLGYAFNHWVGLFHGVLPGVFTYSHLFNHHKFDNDDRDLYTTALRPRDEFGSWLRYLPEWLAYASNLNNVRAFLNEERYTLAWKTVAGTAWYVLFVAACARVHFTFTLLTIVYAFFEANILLSVVNYTWHAFIEETDPSNDYVNSTNIIEGENFTLAEEYHTVHHQYAGAHWSTCEALYNKHMSEGYKKGVPTVFYRKNLFELFGLIVSKQYLALADAFYEPLRHGKSREELAAMLQARLRCHGPELASRVGRRHKAPAANRTNGAASGTLKSGAANGTNGHGAANGTNGDGAANGTNGDGHGARRA